MTRAIAITLLLGGLAAAEGPGPMIWATGTTLDGFQVEVDMSRLDRSSAPALAESFCRFHVEQHEVSRSFTLLFQKMHLELLRRYYQTGLVDIQRKAYLALPVRKGLSCRVAEMEPPSEDGEVAAVLRREWEGGSQLMRLVLRKGEDGWVLRRILHEKEAGGYEDRGLGVPPALGEVKVPDRSKPDQSSARAAIASLKTDMLRLRALSWRGRLALYAHYFEILSGFCGSDAAERARKEQPVPKGWVPREFKIAHATESRVDVLAQEEVLGTGGKRSAIGAARFDLTRGADGAWRVSAEWSFPDPERPPVRLPRDFALFFLG
jgi:hypothetical protein